MHIYILLFATMIGCGVHIAIYHTPVLETLLLYFLVIYYGIGGLLFAFGHLFMSDKVAEHIGWPKGNPFQLEVGMANVSFGSLGILSVFFDKGFWLASGLGYSIFLLGAAMVHLMDIQKNKNYAPGNSSVALLLINDILVPVIVIILCLLV